LDYKEILTILAIVLRITIIVYEHSGESKGQITTKHKWSKNTYNANNKTFCFTYEDNLNWHFKTLNFALDKLGIFLFNDNKASKEFVDFNKIIIKNDLFKPDCEKAKTILAKMLGTTPESLKEYSTDDFMPAHMDSYTKGKNEKQKQLYVLRLNKSTELAQKAMLEKINLISELFEPIKSENFFDCEVLDNPSSKNKLSMFEDLNCDINGELIFQLRAIQYLETSSFINESNYLIWAKQIVQQLIWYENENIYLGPITPHHLFLTSNGIMKIYPYSANGYCFFQGKEEELELYKKEFTQYYELGDKYKTEGFKNLLLYSLSITFAILFFRSDLKELMDQKVSGEKILKVVMGKYKSHYAGIYNMIEKCQNCAYLKLEFLLNDLNNIIIN